MTIHPKHLIGACLVGLLMWFGMIAGATHAFATDSAAGWYTWSTTLAPGVTEPHNDGDVTWPQTLVGKGQIAPACEKWVQQDRYEGSNEAIEAVVGDGVLTRINGQPEDHAIYREHRFVYGGACPEPEPSATSTPTPEPTETPTPTPTATEPPVTTVSKHTERHVDCDLGVAIVLTEWTYSDGTSRTVTEQEPLTDKEKATCQPNSTPSATPTSKPTEPPAPSHPATTSPKPGPSGSPTSTPPSEPVAKKPVTPSLPVTGSSGVVYLVVSLGLIGLGATLYLLNRRKNNGY